MPEALEQAERDAYGNQVDQFGNAIWWTAPFFRNRARMRQCRGANHAGQRCGQVAVRDGDYCRQHARSAAEDEE